LPRLLTAALLLGLLLALPAQAAGAGEGALVLSTADPAPRSRPDGTGSLDRIVAEACRRLDLPVRLVQLPAERALQNANQGVDDGTYTRIAGLTRLYPNLVMVPEPISEFVFTAFTRDPAVRVQGWADLKPYNVGFINGWKIVEASTTDVRSRTSVKDETALFALLDKGRAEVVVVDLYSGQEVIRSSGYQGMRALAPPLERRDMFLYLHKRHADLVPRLADALRQMKRDGTFERLIRAGQ
jgi:polar amino acid transport system substrate-binding protein